MRECAACGHGNRGDARFCADCGAELALVCAACGRRLQFDARFCDACGSPLSPRAPSAAPTRARRRHAAEGERKHVTVLFADVVGSTALAERLDPEEMRDLMDRCFRILVEQVERYQGSVTQFTGDGLMALFGAPLALDNAPECAVLAGLEMQAAARHCAAEVRRDYAVDLALRVGIHSGLVVVGNVGDDQRAEYTAIGDTTNLASRLQTAARPGTVLISDATAKLIGRRFALHAVGPLSLKGKAQPVPAHEVLRAVPQAPLIPLADGRTTPLIGRERERSTLQSVVAEMVGGHGQVVLLAGEPGIGKSRLLYELRQDTPDSTATWLIGRCVSFGQGMPLLPVIDLVKAVFDIEEGDGDRDIAAKLEREVDRLGIEPARVLPYARALLSLDPGNEGVLAMEPGARHFATLNALKTLLFAHAARRPVIVLIEDLHWIDRASEDFLAYIVDSIPPAPILLLCTHRPGYVAAFADRSFVTRLPLQPLRPQETSQLAAAVVGAALPDAIAELIVRRAEGNPFFIEEITKTLLEVGALQRTDDGLVVSPELSDSVVPDTIHGVIMARIDRLGDEPKRAIQVASVIGREFALRLLARAAELGDNAGSLLGELRALELIYEKSGVPELAYMFKHALTHDVAYQSLLLQRRRQLHRTIGIAVEELYADRVTEYLETLAHHFSLAEEWDRAFHYLVRSGDKAMERFANSAAIDHYERALAIADKTAAGAAERMAILRQKAMAHLCVSEFPEAIDAFQGALELCGDEGVRASIQAVLAIALWYAHDFDRATAVAGESLASARRLGDTQTAAQASCAIGVVRMVRGQLEEASQAFDAACSLGVGTDPVFGSWALSSEALAQNWRGDYAPAIERLDRLVDEARGANQLWSLSQIASHRAITLGGAGEYDLALASLRESIAMAESIGEKFWRGRMWNTSGWIHGELGAYEIAEEANQRCLGIAAQLGSMRAAPELIGNARCNLADAALARDDLAAAQVHLEVVAAILADEANEWMTWRYSMHYQLSAAELLLRRGDRARARRRIDLAMAAAERTGSRRYIVRALRALAQCHAADGDLAAAEEMSRRAVAAAEMLRNPPQLWQSLIARAELMERSDRREERDACYRRAAEVLTAVATGLPPQLIAALQQSPAGRTALG